MAVVLRGRLSTWAGKSPGRWLGAGLAGAVLLALLAGLGPAPWRWWLTPDQRGLLLLKAGEPAAAALVFESSRWRAAALYAAADYAGAERLWRQQPGAVAAFNLGAALAQQGRYREAADSFRLALAERPDWTEAQQNLALLQTLSLQSEREPETAGEGAGLAADGLVFDGKAGDSAQREEVQGADPDAGLNDEQRKSLWLRRLSASPADFLRLKFAYQRQQGDSP